MEHSRALRDALKHIVGESGILPEAADLRLHF